MTFLMEHAGQAVSLWPLLGVGIVVLGFALRLNPMLVVTAAAIATGMASSMSAVDILGAIGTAFVKSRNLPLLLLLPLAVVGLLERHGLREHAQTWISRFRSATVGRLLVFYLLVRELTAAVGLTSLGGQAQMVRPLLAPMAEGAAEARLGRLPENVRERVLAFCAATDNIGLFFGEDIFVAFGAVALMHTFLLSSNVDVEPMRIAIWGIPTAACAYLVHAVRLVRLDGWLARESKKSPS